MPIPPDPILRAAQRWLERLPVSGVARSRALFTTHGDFSDLTPTQYEAAYAWLLRTGLLAPGSRAERLGERLFDAALLSGEPLWLHDADRLIRMPDELPADARRAAQVLGLSDVEAWTRIHSLWGKVDSAERERVGAAGEAALMRLLKESCAAEVDHMAATSDGYGFDISVGADGEPVHLEIKSTTRRSGLSIYLSRHEYLTMLNDPAWQLVGIRLSAALEPVAVATVPSAWLKEQVPSDQGTYGRWESCRVDVPPGILIPGIPALFHTFHGSASPLLTGAAGWPQ